MLTSGFVEELTTMLGLPPRSCFPSCLLSPRKDRKEEHMRLGCRLTVVNMPPSRLEICLNISNKELLLVINDLCPATMAAINEQGISLSTP